MQVIQIFKKIFIFLGFLSCLVGCESTKKKDLKSLYILFDKGELDSVKNIINDQSYNYENKVEVLYLKSIINYEENDFKNCIVELDKIIAIFPNDSQCLYLLAKSHYNLGNYNKAYFLFEKCCNLKLNERNKYFYHFRWIQLQLTNILASMSYCKSALKEYDIALQLCNEILNTSTSVAGYIRGRFPNLTLTCSIVSLLCQVRTPATVLKVFPKYLISIYYRNEILKICINGTALKYNGRTYRLKKEFEF